MDLLQPLLPPQLLAPATSAPVRTIPMATVSVPPMALSAKSSLNLRVHAVPVEHHPQARSLFRAVQVRYRLIPLPLPAPAICVPAPTIPMVMPYVHSTDLSAKNLQNLPVHDAWVLLHPPLESVVAMSVRTVDRMYVPHSSMALHA